MRTCDDAGAEFDMIQHANAEKSVKNSIVEGVDDISRQMTCERALTTNDEILSSLTLIIVSRSRARESLVGGDVGCALDVRRLVSSGRGLEAPCEFTAIPPKRRGHRHRV